MSGSTVTLKHPAANSPTVRALERPGLSERLSVYRLVNNLTYEELARKITRINRLAKALRPNAAMRACKGGKMTARRAFQVQTFLESVGA